MEKINYIEEKLRPYIERFNILSIDIKEKRLAKEAILEAKRLANEVILEANKMFPDIAKENLRKWFGIGAGRLSGLFPKPSKDKENEEMSTDDQDDSGKSKDDDVGEMLTGGNDYSASTGKPLKDDFAAILLPLRVFHII